MKEQAILLATRMYLGPKCGLAAVHAIAGKFTRKTAITIFYDSEG